MLLEGGGWQWRIWVATTHVGNQDGAPSCLWLGTVLAATAIWGVNWEMVHLCLTPAATLTFK